MKNEVFNLKGLWQVSFNGRVASATWLEKGPALACLELLEKGFGELLPSGGIKWVK